MSSFQYIIHSRDNITNSTTQCHSSDFILNGLPPNKKFLCEVKSFLFNVKSLLNTFSANQSYVHLVSPSFIKSNQTLSANRSLSVIAYVDTISGVNNNVNLKFIVDNFNGKMFHFDLLDTRFINLDISQLNSNSINSAWTLILELTPIEE